MTQRNLLLSAFILVGFSKTLAEETTIRDSLPVHYLLIDSTGQNYNQEKNILNFSIEQLQDTSLPWWEKSVLYQNYFASSVNLFFPIAESKAIWELGYKNDPFSACDPVNMEFERMKDMKYYKNIPLVLHCLLMRERTFFEAHCNAIREDFDSVLIQQFTLIQQDKIFIKEAQSIVDGQIEKTGRYPGRSTVGLMLESVAWSVMKQGDLTYLQKHLPLFQKAVEEKELHPRFVAAIIDKIEIFQGKPQIYGTQYQSVNGIPEPYPIKDRKNIDKLRIQMGLGAFGADRAELGDIMIDKKKNN